MEPIKDIVKDIGNDNTGKTAGVISYITPIGWLVAYFGIHQKHRTFLGSYQLRQTLLFYIAYVVIRYGLSFILDSLWTGEGFFSLYYMLKLVDFVFFILWIIGFVGAVNGERKPIPFFERAQTIFSNL